MYAIDMRMYDPAIARWVVIDPVTHHSQSTYMGFDGNPVFWSDPSGASVTVYTGQAAIDFFISERDRIDDEIKRKQQDNDDDITVNSSGIITEIARNNRPNRFFDENGKEIYNNSFKYNKEINNYKIIYLLAKVKYIIIELFELTDFIVDKTCPSLIG